MSSDVSEELMLHKATMAKTVKRSRPDICAWWFSWGGLLVSGTTAVALFAEYFSKLSETEEEKSK